MKKICSIIIFLLFFMGFNFVVHGQELEVSGKINFMGSDNIVINNTYLKIDDNTKVIYKNQLGTQLIKIEEIPLGAFGVAQIKDITIKNLEISGESINAEEIAAQEIFKIDEWIDKFQISYDGKYFAYYSNQEGKLIIKVISSGKIIWQKYFHKTPVFKFNPQSPEIIYSFNNNKFFGLESYNLLTNCNRIIMKTDELSNEYINYFEIAHNGEYFAYTTIDGSINSQGYVSKIQLIDTIGNSISVLDEANINFIIWSPDNSLLAFSKFEEPYLVTNQIGYYNLKTKKYSLLQKEKNSNQCNPIFTKDSSKIIYTVSENFIDKVLLYDLNTGNTIELFDDYNYITDFCWLDDNTLIYTYGATSQIKSINLNTKEALNIGKGYSPIVQNNVLYFLKNDLEGSTYLYLIKN